MVRFTVGRGLKMAAAAAVLALGLFAGTGGGAARPAEAADPPLSVSISGSFVVRSWESPRYEIKVKNPNATRMSNIYVDIFHGSLPIDFSSIEVLPPPSGYHCYTTTSGFTCHSGQHPPSLTCQIVDGLSWGGARAACTGSFLEAGEEVTIRLKGGTSVVFGTWTASMAAVAYLNYPDNTNPDSIASMKVAVNP